MLWLIAILFIVFIIWYLTFRSESKRWADIIRIENEKWTQKFEMDKEERDRQYEIFQTLMENLGLQSGLMKIIETKVDQIPEHLKTLNHRVESLETTHREGFRTLHGRIDQALKKDCP